MPSFYVRRTYNVKSHPSIQRKVLFDLTFIAIAVVLFVLAASSGVGTVKREVPSVFLGLYIIYIGILFLLSYFLSDESYVLKVLMCFCEHFSHPRTRYMAFFYFGLSRLVGGCALLSGLGLLRLDP